jgi:hypothetical protein
LGKPGLGEYGRLHAEAPPRGSVAARQNDNQVRRQQKENVIAFLETTERFRILEKSGRRVLVVSWPSTEKSGASAAASRARET